MYYRMGLSYALTSLKIDPRNAGFEVKIDVRKDRTRHLSKSHRKLKLSRFKDCTRRWTTRMTSPEKMMESGR